MPETSAPNDFSGSNAASPSPIGDAALSDYARRPRPRLLATAADFDRLRRLAEEEDPLVCRGLEAIAAQAGAQGRKPPLTRVLSGRRLLPVARRILQQLIGCALLFRVRREPHWLDWARAQMDEAAAFADWNAEEHFLDTAELCAGMAIAYDWLHDELDPAARRRYARALVEHAFRPALAEPPWWLRVSMNWNPVCNGGLALGALALADETPEMSRELLARACAGIPEVREAYAPDGAYVEGPRYWVYGTEFLCLYFAAMEPLAIPSARPRDFPEVLASLRYMRHVVGNTGHYFDYGDNRPWTVATHAELYLAEATGDPALLEDSLCILHDFFAESVTATARFRDWPYLDENRLAQLALLRYRPPEKRRAERPSANAFVGRGETPVALFRTGWRREDAYLGIKGGSPGSPHAHMDGGSFVYECGGVRWIVDSGKPKYETAEAAGLDIWESGPDSDRWRVFRMGPEGHNIPRFGDGGQATDGRALLTGSNGHRAVFDLSGLYPDHLESLEREASLEEDGAARIEDRWQGLKPGLPARFQLMTRAVVESRDGGLLLRRDGRQLSVRIDASAAYDLEVEPMAPLQSDFDEAVGDLTRITLSFGASPHLRDGFVRLRLGPAPQ